MDGGEVLTYNLTFLRNVLVTMSFHFCRVYAYVCVCVVGGGGGAGGSILDSGLPLNFIFNLHVSYNVFSLLYTSYTHLLSLF